MKLFTKLTSADMLKMNSLSRFGRKVWVRWKTADLAGLAHLLTTVP